jgi:SAM-dependent methyltransferase
VKSKYIHTERVHNLGSPSIVVPILIELFSPESVIDVGCGTGNFLKIFRDNGIQILKGLDGKWANRELLFKHIHEDEFEEIDLENFSNSKKRYDLAICLEVAEHLKPEAASQFIKALCTYSDTIVFSAAVPDQGGQNHLNEQWPTYWGKLFEQQGFKMYDPLRPLIWNNPSVSYWYKQNVFAYMRNNTVAGENEFKAIDTTNFMNAIHPDIFQYKSQMLERILQGKFTFKGYVKMFLKYLKKA